ncbi:MAG: coproporphyrinogen dehydrogenase HemZ [Lachnospiraceae bacterium]|nr:coproporphyrinogen dehydrogenase HemZ [Lachnospiraceae bacterium]
MTKNDVSLKINGLDFRQDVEPLIKEFFPGLMHDGKVEISISAGEHAFDIAVCIRKNPDEDILCDGIKDETVDFSSENDPKIRHRDYRNQLLRGLYRILSHLTGQELPWGILTGVRPTKLVYERIERGEAAPWRFLEQNYYCSHDKSVLASLIAATEYRLLEDMDYKNGYSLYVGIPFCPSICNYCTFGSHPIKNFQDCVEPYIEALEKEISYSATYFHDIRLKTVYIGGGTPTAISAGQLARVIDCITGHFDMSDVREFTVEAGRPDSIDRDKLRMLKSRNIGRISINPQTFVQRTLDLIGREHTAEQVVAAFEMAREEGFDSINMDLIAGLTGESAADFMVTLENVSRLAPDSVTVHTLARKRAARITMNPELYEGYESRDTDKMLDAAARQLKEDGYAPYYLYRQKNMTGNLENIGYSKPGKECLYNILIMEEKHPIIACGAGASSKFVREGQGRFGRVENVKNVREYIARIDEMIARKRDYKL